MANASMYLVHIPTAIACYLGSRRGFGWETGYETKEVADTKLERFFWMLANLLPNPYERVEGIEYGHGLQDDFGLFIEGDESQFSQFLYDGQYLGHEPTNSFTWPDGFARIVPRDTEFEKKYVKIATPEQVIDALKRAGFMEE